MNELMFGGAATSAREFLDSRGGARVDARLPRRSGAAARGVRTRLRRRRRRHKGAAVARPPSARLDLEQRRVEPLPASRTPDGHRDVGRARRPRPSPRTPGRPSAAVPVEQDAEPAAAARNTATAPSSFGADFVAGFGGGRRAAAGLARTLTCPYGQWRQPEPQHVPRSRWVASVKTLSLVNGSVYIGSSFSIAAR